MIGILVMVLFTIPPYAYALEPFTAIILGTTIGVVAHSLISWSFGGSTIIGALADSVGAVGIDILTTFVSWLGTVIVSFFLFFSAALLELAVDPGIGRVTDFPLVQAIVPVAQGLANLLLIAILIIVALATILGIESYGVRRLVPLLVGIVLLVNFSSVIAGVVIDAGQVGMNFMQETFSKALPEEAGKKQGLSGYLSFQLGLSREFAIDSATSERILGKRGVSYGDESAFEQQILNAFSVMIMIIIGAIAGYIFLRLAILLLMRYTVFWFLLIIAPLAFFAGILPATRNYFRTWWHQLLNWSFLGFTTLFIVYLGALAWGLLNNPDVIRGTYAAFEGSRLHQRASLLFTFPIVAFFFLYALNVSKKMAGAAANAVVDGVISLGKAVVVGGAAFAAGAGIAKAGGTLLRSPRVKKVYEALQRGAAPFQAAGRRLEAAHRAAVEEEQKLAKGIYSGLDALSSADLVRRFDEFSARQKVVAAGILQERKETLPQPIAQEALRLSTSMDKEVERRLKHSAPHARFYSPDHAETENINVSSAHNYMITNNVRGVELAPEALENAAIAGLLNTNQLYEIARRGTSQQLAKAVKGIEDLAGKTDLQEKIANATNRNVDEYKKAIDDLVNKVRTEPIFKVGGIAGKEPTDVIGGGGNTT